jgi:hypothetical protein
MPQFMIHYLAMTGKKMVTIQQLAPDIFSGGSRILAPSGGTNYINYNNLFQKSLV